MKSITPSGIPPPFARYAHGIKSREPSLDPNIWQLITAEDRIPDDPYDQAMICFDTMKILAEGMSIEDIVMSPPIQTAPIWRLYGARDQVFQNKAVLPSSTLLIVSGFTKPEFKVEIGYCLRYCFFVLCAVAITYVQNCDDYRTPDQALTTWVFAQYNQTSNAHYHLKW